MDETIAEFIKKTILKIPIKGPGEDLDLFDMEQVKGSFETILQGAENAVWVRIAWGTQWSKPTQYKPAYALPVASQHHMFVKMDPKIIHENEIEKESPERDSRNFGDYPQPRLEFHFWCLIKFPSPHLLEALKSSAPASTADAPLSPLLTCMPHKGMNYIKVRCK
ncbi:unnamed protein product [Nyctereutes procyonoides]|uniref:(raccoon dog) hypothetical protein n=1 Tax=Nyctereutes procyonoides TaxID=34880 RepID=A0A811YPA8_NYCPR|nr:unnamed protein product [Nyctereutes procyonoides]CAD7688257.1 unnamed protein product [Nyctereutes procyonoides]